MSEAKRSMRRRPVLLIGGAVAVLAAACGATAAATEIGAGPDGAKDPGPGFGQNGNPQVDASDVCASSSQSADRATVDVIFVIDTSASMGDEINQVRKSINAFATSIGNTGLDANVVMVAERGDPLGMCVPEPLASAGCGDSEKFHHLNVDINSWEMLQVLLDEYPAYSKWLRPEAQKVFILISDDDAQLAWQTFDQKLLALSGAQFGTAQARRYIFDSIVGYKRNTAVLSSEKCATAHNIGEHYQHLSQLTGGTVDSICETDYGSVFNNVTKGLLLKLGCEFAVPEAPGAAKTDPSTVALSYTPGGGKPRPLTQVTDSSKCATIEDGWFYDDAKNPTRIVFCASTCSGPGADPAGKLDVAVGCNTPPPK